MQEAQKRAANLCAILTKKYDPFIYEEFILQCRAVGKHISSALNFMPPNEYCVSDVPYDGSSHINMYKTISNFCTHGRMPEFAVGRKRVQKERVVRIALLYDDSNSMTAWWRSDFLNKQIAEEEAPQTFAKIACVSLCEIFGPRANPLILSYSDDAIQLKGYRELVIRNGSGATRLDKALYELERMRWHIRGGKRIIVILTDGLPEGGMNDYMEDCSIQKCSLELLVKFSKWGVRILYLPLLLEAKYASRVWGMFSALTFTEEIEKQRIVVERVKSIHELPTALFRGVKKVVA
ncbi:MAG: hypothetical protein QXP42_00605 [Candidatus Micrarchaeia archaeon]